MWWRLKHSDYLRGRGQANERAFQRLVQSGVEPGLLFYARDQVMGWCAIAPRQDLVRFETARALKPVDDQPVWSVTCFFVAREFRDRGVTRQMLEAAAEFARRHGAKIVEGYPIDSAKKQAPVFVYTGLASMFRRAGFAEVARRAPARPIMRKILD